MSRVLALLWLAVLLAGGAYLAVRLHDGLPWRTDLMGLLPHDARDLARQQAETEVTQALSQRVLVMVGHADAEAARSAARALIRRLEDAAIAQVEPTVPGPEALARLGALYAPYRNGLLSETDRAALLQGNGQAVAERALAQVFGLVGMGDARLLRADPFLLLPGFLTSLPVPFPRVSVADGMPMVTDAGQHWVLVAARLTADPYALRTQRLLLDATAVPAGEGLTVLRLGAAFFAQAGAETAIEESNRIGLVSILGTIALILAVYRALAPLWLSLLVIAAGVLAGLVASLLLFGELHVATLMFGVTLIGVSVDYAIQYCTEVFAPWADPATRLRRVRAGIALGTLTTVIGYLTLWLAPFPGLHQLAVFSAAGLAAAWCTVMLWLPKLDRARPPRHGAGMLAATAVLLGLWRGRRRVVAVVMALGIAAAGLPRLSADDDIRRMQSLSPSLLADQARIRGLIGGIGEGAFFLVRAGNDEAALRAEEALGERLAVLRANGALAGWLATALFVPSSARQQANQALVARGLGPLRPGQLGQLGLDGEAAPAMNDGTLALPAGLPFGSLVLGPGRHIVLLDRATRPEAIAAAAEGLEGVTYVDPASRFSAVLGAYRVRALWLLALSALLMAPPLVLRYGFAGTGRVLLPPTLALLLAPALRSLAGAGFTFFDAMALVLVLSIGVDYAIFCAETSAARAPVTMLAVSLAAATTLLSFGLLAFSRVTAVHAFGSTMTLGILAAFLLAPMARGVRPP